MLFASSLLFAVAAGCRAQDAAKTPANSALDRKIETTIRNELSVPPEYNVTLSPEKPSEMAGYNSVMVTFALPGHPDHTQQLEYLVSKDGNTLARLSKFDISKDWQSSLPIENRPVRGNPEAKVTIVNFDDLECPFCARMHAEFFPDVLDHYKGLVKVIYVDFPLSDIHPWALHAAIDANCLAGEDKTAYWNFVDYVHTHGQDVSGPEHSEVKSDATLDKLARQEGAREHIDETKLDGCLAKQDAAVVRGEMRAADHLGISATPTFFVNGVRWSGALDRSELDLMIDRALRQQGVTPPPPETSAAPASATASASH